MYGDILCMYSGDIITYIVCVCVCVCVCTCVRVCVCLLQPGVHIRSLHCAYDRLSCAGVKTVRLYDSHQGSLTKISVSIPLIS